MGGDSLWTQLGQWREEGKEDTSARHHFKADVPNWDGTQRVCKFLWEKRFIFIFSVISPFYITFYFTISLFCYYNHSLRLLM